jgi:hypothetical protein
MSKTATCVSTKSRIVIFSESENQCYHSWGERHWGIGGGDIYVTRTLQAKVWLNYASMIIHLRVDGERWNEALIRGVYLGCFKHFPFFINIWKFFVQIDFGCSRYSGLILLRVVAVCSNVRI